MRVSVLHTEVMVRDGDEVQCVTHSGDGDGDESQCAHVKDPKHWQQYYCLDTGK